MYLTLDSGGDIMLMIDSDGGTDLEGRIALPKVIHHIFQVILNLVVLQLEAVLLLVLLLELVQLKIYLVHDI